MHSIPSQLIVDGRDRVDGAERRRTGFQTKSRRWQRRRPIALEGPTSEALFDSDNRDERNGAGSWKCSPFNSCIGNAVVPTFVAVNRLLMSSIRNTRHQHRPLPRYLFSLLQSRFTFHPYHTYSSPFRDIHPYNQRVNRPCCKRDYYLDNRKINCKMRRFTLPAVRGYGNFNNIFIAPWLFLSLTLSLSLFHSQRPHKRQHRAFVGKGR